jgi:hypothetical protein
MSPAMQLKYAALRRRLHRARERGEMQHVTMTQQLIDKLIESSMSSASTAGSSSVAPKALCTARVAKPSC